MEELSRELEKIINIEKEKNKKLKQDENELSIIRKRKNELIEILGENEYYIEFRKRRVDGAYIYLDKWTLKNKINSSIHIDIILDCNKNIKNNCKKFLEHNDITIEFCKYSYRDITDATVSIIHKNDKIYLENVICDEEDAIYSSSKIMNGYVELYRIGKDNLIKILTQIVETDV